MKTPKVQRYFKVKAIFGLIYIIKRLLNLYCEIFGTCTSSYGEKRTSLRVRLRHMSECRIFHKLLDLYCEIFGTRSYGGDALASPCVFRHLNSCRIFHNINAITYIRHSFIWRRHTRKLVRLSPYELVPNISQYIFNNL